MATSKQRVTIWLDPDVHHALRLIAAMNRMPIGDVIKTMLSVAVARNEKTQQSQ